MFNLPFEPKTAGESSAYQAGEAEGLNPTPHTCCPYDGRTRIGKSWWAGFVAGDRRRCAERRSAVSGAP